MLFIVDNATRKPIAKVKTMEEVTQLMERPAYQGVAYDVIDDSEDVLERYKKTELVELYNNSLQEGQEPINTFSNKPQGTKRVLQNLAKYDYGEAVTDQPKADQLDTKPVKGNRRTAMIEFLQGRIGQQVSKDDLRELFAKFGEVKEATLAAAISKYPPTGGLKLERSDKEPGTYVVKQQATG